MNISKDIIDTAAKVLQEWGNEATFEMKRLLKERAKNPNDIILDKSLIFDGTTITTNGTTAIWNLNDYWIYVDLGVKGLKNVSSKGRMTNTYTSKDYPQGFRFRNLGTPPQMVNAMQNYIARKGIKVRQNKNQKTSDVIANSFKMARAMSISVKLKGIDGTRFYSDVFNEKGFKKLTDRLENALGQEVEIKIISAFK